MSTGQSTSQRTCDADVEIPFPPHFNDLKRVFQMAEKKEQSKGEESDFSAAVREKNESRAYELVSSTFYYWGSLLDGSNIDCLLTSKGQCILIDAPPTMLSGRERSRFTLAVHEGVLKYYSVKCAANELIIIGIARKLGKFIAEEQLQPVQRQYVWREDQLSSPIDGGGFSFDTLYEVGKVQRRQIQFPCGKSIQVIAIVVSELSPQERNVIINDLATYKDFGSMNTQRLWGSMVSDTQITLLLEDTAVESLSSYVTSDDRASGELLKFARQMATAVDFFERVNFVHKKLSLDVCLLSVYKTVKIVIFGLSTGLIPKRIYLEDVERCRWMPWECLAGPDGDPEPYEKAAVIWTLGTMIWSMFHRAAIPFENETVTEIRSRKFRKDCSLEIIEELLPPGVLQLIRSCWEERSKRPTSREVLKTIKKLERQQ